MGSQQAELQLAFILTMLMAAGVQKHMEDTILATPVQQAWQWEEGGGGRALPLAKHLCEPIFMCMVNILLFVEAFGVG